MHANNLTQVPRNLLPHQKETRKYFWGKGYDENDKSNLPVYGGYAEAGEIVGDGSIATLEAIAEHGIKVMSTLFENMSDPSASEDLFVSLRLSDDLLQWREEQWAQGKILPTKGNGIKRASEEVIELLGVKGWPEPLLTNGALFGSVLANLLIGAHVSISEIFLTSAMLIRYRTSIRFIPIAAAICKINFSSDPFLKCVLPRAVLSHLRTHCPSSIPILVL